MTDYTLADLARLGTPAILEELDFEAILAARKAEIVARAPAYGLTYDVEGLESDPAVIVAEDGGYREVLLRARGNDIARARYLHFARGAEVDHLGAFYDCVRLSGESDERYKERIVLAVQGRSTGGTAPRYRFVAMTADLRVEDVAVYQAGTDPTVIAAVFATDNNGVADTQLLAAVDAALQDEAVRMVNDRIVVRSAVVTVTPVTAALKLLPGVPETVLATLAAALPGAWKAASGLGRDLTHDWLTGWFITQAGVHSVEITAPAADVVMAPFDACRIGAVTLTFAGRDF